MTTFNMVHTSDLHLGSLFSSTPEVAEQRKQEQLDTLRQILDLCTANKADALLIAGDMFDSMRVENSYLEQIKRLISHYNLRIFITPGQHDPATPDSCYNTDWPQNVHIFRGRMEKVEIPDDGFFSTIGTDEEGDIEDEMKLFTDSLYGEDTTYTPLDDIL